MGKIWLLPVTGIFIIKKSGQDLLHAHVLLLKKSNLEGVFIRTNDSYLGICFPSSSRQFLPSFFPPSSCSLPLSSPSLPQSLPSFLTTFYPTDFSILSHIVVWLLLLKCLHVWMNQGHNFQCKNKTSSTFSWFIRIYIIWLLYAIFLCSIYQNGSFST